MISQLFRDTSCGEAALYFMQTVTQALNIKLRSGQPEQTGRSKYYRIASVLYLCWRHCVWRPIQMLLGGCSTNLIRVCWSVAHAYPSSAHGFFSVVDKTRTPKTAAVSDARWSGMPWFLWRDQTLAFSSVRVQTPPLLTPQTQNTPPHAVPVPDAGAGAGVLMKLS